MPTPQPLASFLLTAATRYILTAADFSASAPYNAAIEDIRYVCGITVHFTHSSAGPYFLSLLPDIASGSPTEAPVDEIEVTPGTPSADWLPRRREWLPPLTSSRLDIVFADKFWGASGLNYFKPDGDISVIVHAYPSKFTT